MEWGWIFEVWANEWQYSAYAGQYTELACNERG